MEGPRILEINGYEEEESDSDEEIEDYGMGSELGETGVGDADRATVLRMRSVYRKF